MKIPQAASFSYQSGIAPSLPRALRDATLERKAGRIMNLEEMMKVARSIGTYVLFCTFGFLLSSLPAFCRHASRGG